MCLKVCVSVAFCFASILTLSDGFFLPVFVRKQHPQTPALNNAQWTSYQSSGSLSAGIPNSPTSGGGGGLNMNLNAISSNSNPNPQMVPNNAYKDYNGYQQQSQGMMTPLHQVHVAPVQTQYTYESGAPPYLGPGTYPQQQYHSAFQSVQLVPCLCPISKEIIEQQSNQFQHPQQQPINNNSPTSSASSVESGANDVLTKGSQKVNS